MRGRTVKAGLAGVLVALSLAILPIVGIGAAPPQSLIVQGAQLNTLADGSVQLIVDLAIMDIELFSSAYFRLNFNEKYIYPSDFATNERLLRSGEEGPEHPDAFFQVSEDLYFDADVPFATSGLLDAGAYGNKNDYVTFTGSDAFVYFNLLFRKPLLRDIPESAEYEETGLDGCLLEAIPYGTGTGDPLEDWGYTLSTGAGNSVALGKLSFWVDPDHAMEMIALFDGMALGPSPSPGGSTEKLFEFSAIGSEPAIGYYEKTQLDYVWRFIVGANVQRLYAYQFPKTAVGLRMAEPEVTVNAYQAYVDGDVSDIPKTMQKYSPMVVVRYADGSEEMYVMPWGRAELPDDISCFHITDGYNYAAPDYDPRGDKTYKMEQYFTLPGETVPFPVPVEATLHVTPIAMTGLAVDNQDITYVLPSTTEGVPQNDPIRAVREPPYLLLPDRARILTDVPAGAASLSIPLQAWSSGNSGAVWPGMNGQPADAMDLLRADEAGNDPPPSPDPHWPVESELGGGGVYNQSKHLGTYTFYHSATYGAGTESPLTQARIAEEYRWLTVPETEYAVPKAKRFLVPAENTTLDNWYVISAKETITDGNGHPTATLVVKKVSPLNENIIVNMKEGAQFRIRLPNGEEIITDGTSDDWFERGADFGNNINESFYREAFVADEGGYRGYELSANPGDTSGKNTDTYVAERELLRRWINLGGWFYVSVNEDPGNSNYLESGFIPVYVSPRENPHLESKEYRFIGVNQGLLAWPGGIGSTLTLPIGQYHDVSTENGKPLYTYEALIGGTEETTDPNDPDALGASITPLYRRFGAQTRYHGETGAEPGELHTFSVNPELNTWPSAAMPWTPLGEQVQTYGPAPFVDGARYGAYGEVTNPDDTHTVTINRHPDIDPAAQTEGLRLRYYGVDTSVEQDPLPGNLNRVTFRTQQEGYTYRQDFLLTIENYGDTDIYDLRVDTKTGAAYPDASADGCYVLLQEPARFLPAGGSTTFRLTYVYKLPGGGGGASKRYLENLYITSSSRPTANPTDPSSYWIRFQACFDVSPEMLFRVDVKVIPPADADTGEVMGSAEIIMGEEDDPANPGGKRMNYTPTANVFAGNSKVYIVLYLNDEYVLKDSTARNNLSVALDPNVFREYGSRADETAELPDRVMVFVIDPMPMSDVVVTLTLEEPTSSKLRVGDLKVYSWGSDAEDELSTWNDNSSTPKARPEIPEEYTDNILWQKKFSAAEDTAAASWDAASTRNDEDEYRMMVGRADTAGYDSKGRHFLTVLKSDQEWVQVEAIMRAMLSFGDYNATINSASINMELYRTQPVSGMTTPTTAILSSAPVTISPAASVSTHTSDYFEAPAPGTAYYVHVWVTDAGTVRDYYIEIHRAPAVTEATLGYGNSPAGMIMNDKVMSAANKPLAINAFRSNNYKFAGMNNNYIPAVLVGNTKVQATRYWTEAWKEDGTWFEPESNLGTPPAAADNLDLDPYAFFAILGQKMLDPGVIEARDSSGRILSADDLKEITCSVTVRKLDNAAGSERGRFAGTAAQTIDLGKAGTESDAWLTAPDLVPGRYELIYTFLDYDGVTLLPVPRTLLLLAAPGDVNADGVVNAADAACVYDRVKDPLGHTAPGFDFGNVFRYRSADVNNDRNVNNIDAHQINEDIAQGSSKHAFYLPIGYKPTS